MPLTKEDEAALAELEAEVAKAPEPLPKNVRRDRFTGAPVGMGDDGALFPLEPVTDEEGPAAAAKPTNKQAASAPVAVEPLAAGTRRRPGGT
ncbi:MAG: hypothetical protein MUC96_05795 [Myxococcaceae bacterium]|jgi:hypothetical protein|nr:hypothetical protein [Myxococcaceae bacterium]